MLELARQEHNTRPVTISDIARNQHIPSRFLEAILRELKQAGLTESLRGREGGYHLAKPAHSIRIGEIIRVFEAPISAHLTSGQPDVFAEVWKEAEKSLAKSLDNFDLATMVEKDRLLKEGFKGSYAI